VIELAPNFQYLHFATHGFFAPANVKSAEQLAAAEGESGRLERMFAGLTETRRFQRGFSAGQLSGLVLANANRVVDESGGGYLNADEIAFLPLDGTELVVLSACETNLGETAGGEGLLGLQRGFQISGARSVVASLWKVNDTATMQLMTQFYKNLLNSDASKRSPTRLDALRDAQLALLNNKAGLRGGDDLSDASIPSRLSPKFWAAFVLSGDWR
jgi:CHAT domain-containing protein